MGLLLMGNSNVKPETFKGKKKEKRNTILDGTPISQIGILESKRFPFAVVESNNWFSTQPLLPAYLGTNLGR